jgi:hypothetical protein
MYSVFQKWFLEGARLQPRRSETHKMLALAPEGNNFLKKTRATPDEDLATARKRQKELQR